MQVYYDKYNFHLYICTMKTKKKTTWSYDQCIDAKYTFCVTFVRGGKSDL